MNTFVKIEGYGDQWFLLVREVDEIPSPSMMCVMDKKMQGIVGGELTLFLKGEIIGDIESIRRKLDFVTQNPHSRKKFEQALIKYKEPLLIREIGSFMSLGDNRFIKEIVVQNSEDFPVDGNFDIVVCENDPYPEQKWIEYLSTKFPDLSIGVINLFRHRTETEIKNAMQGAKYVTFYTTFSNMDWVEKMAACASPEQQIIGYSCDPKKWDIALTYLKNFKVEVIDEI